MIAAILAVHLWVCAPTIYGLPIVSAFDADTYDYAILDDINVDTIRVCHER